MLLWGRRWPSEKNSLVLTCLAGTVFPSVCGWFLVFGLVFFPLWIVCFLESAVFQHQYCQTNPCYLSQKFGAGSVGQQWYLQHCTVLICGSSVLLSWRSFTSHGDVQYYQTCKTEYLYSNTYTPKNGQDGKEENSLGIFLSLLLWLQRGQVALNSKDSKTYLSPAVPHASSVKLLWGGYLRTFWPYKWGTHFISEEKEILMLCISTVAFLGVGCIFAHGITMCWCLTSGTHQGHCGAPLRCKEHHSGAGDSTAVLPWPVVN